MAKLWHWKEDTSLRMLALLIAVEHAQAVGTWKYYIISAWSKANYSIIAVRQCIVFIINVVQSFDDFLERVYIIILLQHQTMILYQVKSTVLLDAKFSFRFLLLYNEDLRQIIKVLQWPWKWHKWDESNFNLIYRCVHQKHDSVNDKHVLQKVDIPAATQGPAHQA